MSHPNHQTKEERWQTLREMAEKDMFFFAQHVKAPPDPAINLVRQPDGSWSCPKLLEAPR